MGRASGALARPGRTGCRVAALIESKSAAKGAGRALLFGMIPVAGMRASGKQVIQPSPVGRVQPYIPDSLAEQGSDGTADNVSGKVEVRPPRHGERCGVVQDAYA